MAVKKFPTVRSAYKSMTVAALLAGEIVVPAAADRQYTVLDAWCRSTGGFAAGVHVTLTDGHTTVCTFNHEAMTDAAIVRAGATNTVATNLLTALAVNHPITVSSDNLDTTGSVFEIQVDYAVSNVSETA